KNLKNLEELKSKLAQIVDSEDAVLTSLILDFFHMNFRCEINHLSMPLRERDYTSIIILSLMTDLLEEFGNMFEVFGIEKISESNKCKKETKIHPEYTLFGNKILALEAGNTEMSHDDLKASEDHTGLKIELKTIYHTLLWLDNKLIQLMKQRYSTPSPASSPPPETSETPEVKRVKNDIIYKNSNDLRITILVTE
ncbi:14294_t:CDS:2, partial [Entrophospora sp. SA101]